MSNWKLALHLKHERKGEIEWSVMCCWYCSVVGLMLRQFSTWQRALWCRSGRRLRESVECMSVLTVTFGWPDCLHKSPLRGCLVNLPYICVLDRASSWYLNKGWPIRWHLLYYILLNMFQTLIRPSSGASEYLCCVGWLEVCWCCVAGLSVGDVVSECGSAYTRIPHHQQTIPLHNISTPQVSLHNTTSTR